MHRTALNSGYIWNKTILFQFYFRRGYMWNKFARNISQHANAEAMSAISILIYTWSNCCPSALFPGSATAGAFVYVNRDKSDLSGHNLVRLVLYNRAIICLFLVWNKWYGAITFCGLRESLRGAVSEFRAPLRDRTRTGNLFYFYLWRRKLCSVLWQLLFYHFLKNALRYDVNLVLLLSLTLF